MVIGSKGQPCPGQASCAIWARHLICDLLMRWAEDHVRRFPWRETRDPWRVLLAEVLLQRTRASQAVSAYEEMIGNYPTPAALLSASADELERHFVRTGLRKRAERLLRIAQIIQSEHGGRVPISREALLSLPGVGSYTANAVLCVATGARLPMLDEAAGRVLRRVLGIETNRPVYSDKGLWQLAEQLIPDAESREFNFALLDLGATLCKPRNPRCVHCPLQGVCYQCQASHGAVKPEGQVRERGLHSAGSGGVRIVQGSHPDYTRQAATDL